MQVQTASSEQIKSMPPSMLVSAAYDSQKKSAVLKFYDPKSQKIILWADETNHKPYCYSKLNPRVSSLMQVVLHQKFPNHVELFFHP